MSLFSAHTKHATTPICAPVSPNRLSGANCMLAVPCPIARYARTLDIRAVRTDMYGEG